MAWVCVALHSGPDYITLREYILNCMSAFATYLTHAAGDITKPLLKAAACNLVNLVHITCVSGIFYVSLQPGAMLHIPPNQLH